MRTSPLPFFNRMDRSAGNGRAWSCEINARTHYMGAGRRASTPKCSFQDLPTRLGKMAEGLEFNELHRETDR